MFKLVPILTLPLIFTYVVNYYTYSPNKNISEKKITKISSLNKAIYDVHKNFNLTFDSSTINNLYSKKIIENLDKENIVNLKPKSKKLIYNNDQFKELKFISKSNNSLHFISSEWQNNFSDKKTGVSKCFCARNKVHHLSVVGVTQEIDREW